MKAYITHLNEPTLEVSRWSLERLGFDVTVISGDTSLAMKLAEIYDDADEDFLRIDADVIVSRRLTKRYMYDMEPGIWWRQYYVFDWFRQGPHAGGIQFIKKPAISYLRKGVQDVMDAERPETELWRMPDFLDPRRCETYHDYLLMGIHGYGIRDFQYVRDTKTRRSQFDYDWEMAERLNKL